MSTPPKRQRQLIATPSSGTTALRKSILDPPKTQRAVRLRGACQTPLKSEPPKIATEKSLGLAFAGTHAPSGRAGGSGGPRLAALRRQVGQVGDLGDDLAPRRGFGNPLGPALELRQVHPLERILLDQIVHHSVPELLDGNGLVASQIVHDYLQGGTP